MVPPDMNHSVTPPQTPRFALGQHFRNEGKLAANSCGKEIVKQAVSQFRYPNKVQRKPL
jgi:hypothetical protein